MDKKITEAIKRLGYTLKELGIKPKKIIIFGSYAKSMSRKHSDIDVMVISDDFKGMNLFKRLETLGLALAKAKIMEPIEALGYTEEEYDSKGAGTFIGDEVKPKEVEVKGII